MRDLCYCLIKRITDLFLYYLFIHRSFENTVKHVYKRPLKEPKNVAFMSSCTLYTC